VQQAVRFSGERPSPQESTTVRLIRPDDLLGYLSVQDRPQVSTTVVSTALAVALCIRYPPDLPPPRRGVTHRCQHPIHRRVWHFEPTATQQPNLVL
jgi:hypothetical protein